jgi:glutamate mutase epsilon subunit
MTIVVIVPCKYRGRDATQVKEHRSEGVPTTEDEALAALPASCRARHNNICVKTFVRIDCHRCAPRHIEEAFDGDASSTAGKPSVRSGASLAVTVTERLQSDICIRHQVSPACRDNAVSPVSA